MRGHSAALRHVAPVIVAMLVIVPLSGRAAAAGIPAPPQNLRLSVTPRRGPAGTEITVRSIDPCPAVGGIASQSVDVMIGHLSGDVVLTTVVRGALAPDGSWTVKLNASANYYGPAGISAFCRAPRVQVEPAYAPAQFDVTTSGAGYWLVTATPVPAECLCTVTTNILAAGDASDYGPRPARTQPAPAGIAPNPLTGTGYWLVASDGGVFAMGDARFFGSSGAMRLTRPVVGIAATPSGRGYWLVASDGGVFAFGDARFFGSSGAIRLTRPVVGIAATPSGHGYWLAASDGGVFTFGDARFFGSAAHPGSVASVVGIAATASGRGYWLPTSSGAVFAFGDTPAVAACVEGCGTNAVVAIARTPVTAARN